MKNLTGSTIGKLSKLKKINKQTTKESRKKKIDKSEI
jgi:hypothetical protein